MNIGSLSINMMLNISERWLESDDFRDQLKSAGPLGLGILAELEKAHTPLAELQHKRSIAHAQLRTLIEQSGTLDATHDRHARSLYYHIRGLIEGATTHAEQAEHEALEALFFPDGLRVVRLPYIEEGGAAVALDHAVGPKQRAKLGEIEVGKRTLLDIFEAWMAAGHQLGEIVRQRAELRASLGQDGSTGEAIDLRAGRKQWLQAVRGLLWAIEVNEELGPLAEPVRASLAEAIAISQRRREGGGEVDAAEGDDAELDEPELDAAEGDDAELDEPEADVAE
jgi:hypothetical protein